MEKQEYYFTIISSGHEFDYFYKRGTSPGKRHRLDGPSALFEGWNVYNKYYFYVNGVYICNIAIDIDTGKQIRSYCNLQPK
jgi:hypothetical protein